MIIISRFFSVLLPGFLPQFLQEYPYQPDFQISLIALCLMMVDIDLKPIDIDRHQKLLLLDWDPSILFPEVLSGFIFNSLCSISCNAASFVSRKSPSRDFYRVFTCNIPRKVCEHSSRLEFLPWFLQELFPRYLFRSYFVNNQHYR